MNENKKQYDIKYQRENLKQYKFNCHKVLDQDLIMFLDSVPNRQKFIKELIREEIKKSQE